VKPPLPLTDEQFNELLQQTSSPWTGLLAMLLAATAFVFGVAIAAAAFMH
jgi:hypothetical protein